MTQKPTYLLTDPPAPLSAPVAVELNTNLIEHLNAYRQAQHAYFTAANAPELDQLYKDYQWAGRHLAEALAYTVSLQLGEPPTWGF